jgi:hypothetical protein
MVPVNAARAFRRRRTRRNAAVEPTFFRDIWNPEKRTGYFMPEMRPDDVCREEIRRLSIPVEELKTFEALGF